MKEAILALSVPLREGDRRCSRVKTRVALTVAFLLLLPHPGRAEWRFHGEIGFVYDSNLSNSDRAADVRDDWAWRSEVGVNDGLQLTRDLRLNLGADVRSELWDRFGGFNTVGAGGGAALRYRFGLGRQAPWVSLGDRLGYDRFQDTAQSGYDNVASLRGGVALSERIALEGGYDFETFAAPNEFYDRQVHRGNARLIFDMTSSLQVAIGYTYQEGDVISYAVPPRPDLARFALEREGEDEFGFPLRTAYKFGGRTHAFSFSIGYQLTKRASVEVGYQYSLTARDPIGYEKHLLQAKIAVAY